MSKKLEDWVDMIGYEGLYKVNQMGQILRVFNRFRNGKRKQVNQLTKLNIAGNGYLGFLATNNHGITKRFLVHRVVAVHFLENPDNLPQVNHKDGDKKNNYVSNLEWCTAAHNINHAFKTGLNPAIKNHPKTSKSVSQVTEDGELVATYPSIMEACRSTGFTHPNISLAIKQNLKRYGYYWK